MKRKSSILALVVVLLMMLSIVGCSKKASVDTPAPSEPAASEPAASTPTEPAAPTTDPAAANPAAPTEQAASTPTAPAPGAPAAANPAAPAKPAATAPTAPAKPAASQPAASAPAASAPAAAAAPASLTGDKAKAYTLLAGCKYDGSADGDFAATIYKVPLLGDTDMTVATTSAASSSKMTTKGVPGIVGGDSTNASFASVPFSEVVSGNPAALEAFLKGASSVSVSGSTITVSAQATSSFVTMLNKVSAKVTWSKAKVKLTYTISVASGKVTSIKIATASASCTANGNPYDAKVSGSVNY